MGKNGMVQWATGSRPQKFDRNDGYWELMMDGIEKRVKEREMELEDKIDPGFVEGELVMCRGQIYRAGAVSENGRSVMLGVHKHGTDIVKKLNTMHSYDYLDMCLDLEQDPV